MENNKDIKEKQIDIGEAVIIALVTFVVGILLGCFIVINKQTNPYKNARYAFEKSLTNHDRLVGSFILNDTIIETTKHVTIVSNCISRDSTFIEKKSLPSRYIGVTVGDEIGDVRFFCFTKEKFYSVKKGDEIDVWNELISDRPYLNVVEIDNPIKCK